MKFLRVLIIILSVAGAALAQRADFNFSKMAFGEQVSFGNARMLALGGSGIAGGDAFSALALNPALLSGGNSRIYLQSGLYLNKTVEDRAYPYYDSFVGYNDYGSYAYNEHWYNHFYGIVAYRFMDVLTFAVGYQPFMDFQYDYLEEVRDPNNVSDKLLGYNSLVQDGLLNQIPLAIAYRVMDGLSLGLQAGIIYGDLKTTRSIDPKVASLESVSETIVTDKKLSGTPLVASVGLTYKLNKHMALGVNTRLPYTLTFDNTTRLSADSSYAASRELKYPAQIGAGLDYRFTNVLAARLSFDIVYDFWSQFDDSFNNADFNDTYTIRTGIEHLFFDKVPLRVGFLFGTLRENKGFSRTALTLGSSFVVQNVTVDLAGGVSSLEYYQNDIFADSIYHLTDRSDTDRVNLTSFFLRLDLKYAWGGIK